MATNTTSTKLTLKVASFILRLLLNALFYIIVIIFTVNCSRAAFDFTYQLYGPVIAEAHPGTDVYFEIVHGEKTMDIASKLELKMLIKNKYSFYLKTKLEKSNIIPGTYALNTSMTYDEILAKITDYSASIKPDQKAKNTDMNSKTNAKTNNNTSTRESIGVTEQV
jgi:UPF0755 protein